MRSAAVLLMTLSVGCTDPDADAPDGAASDTPRQAGGAEPEWVWAEVSASTPNLSGFIAKRAEEAYARGLRPVVHLRTMWNSGVTLRSHHGDPRVQQALRGTYLIEVSIDDIAGGDGAWRIEPMICGNYASTFYAVTRDGLPASPVGHPHTKFGPNTAKQNAAFLESYLTRVRESAIDAWTPERAGDACRDGAVPPSVWREG